MPYGGRRATPMLADIRTQRARRRPRSGIARYRKTPDFAI